MIFYFSGTGNSRWVAERINEALHGTIVSMIDILVKKKQYDIKTEEPIGLIFPTYGWDIPAVVRDFISRQRFSGQHYTYVITTCGDDTGCLKQKIRTALKVVGIHLDSAWAVRMPNTYVCLPGFDVDSDRLREYKMSSIPERFNEIVPSIEQRKKGVFDMLPGKFAWIKTYVIGTFFRRFLMSDRPFHVTDACIRCGICRQTCPMENITFEDGHPQWNGHCTMCLGCYHHCPEHAIQYGKSTFGKGQYLFKGNENNLL